MSDHFTNTNQISLPKNIRQMGTPGETQKIYVEDYVYTYLHTFLKEKYKGDTLRAALLLGEHHRQDGVTYSFVKGAISCDFSQLHEKISAELSLAMETYFGDWEMLGWYVSAQGVDAHIQSEIKHYYAGECGTVPHYLIYEDELEKEIDIFAWEQNALHKLTGYYIYYDRNPQMQEFLIKEKGGRPQEAPTFRPVVEEKPVEQKQAEKVVKKPKESARSVGKVRKPQRLVYAACAVVLVLLAAMGVSQIGNYQNLQHLQEAISNTFIPTTEEDVLSDLSEEQQEPTSTEQEEITPANQETEQQQVIPADQELDEDITDGQDAVTTMAPSQPAEPAPEYYVVQKGDSLYSISRTVYENEDMVDAICELNGLNNINLIYEGQKLKLP